MAKYYIVIGIMRGDFNIATSFHPDTNVPLRGMLSISEGGGGQVLFDSLLTKISLGSVKDSYLEVNISLPVCS